MNNSIQQYLLSIKAVCPEIAEDELNIYALGLSLKTYKRKEFYIKQGNIQKFIGYILNGLVRTYYVDENGNEKTIRFIAENQYVGYYAAFLAKEPCDYYFQCLEPTTVVQIPYAHLQQTYVLNPKFERYGRLIAEDSLKMLQSRTKSILFQNAKNRYLDFINNNPKLFNRISLTHLSSYLGVERQSLTRIRKSIIRP